MATDNHKGSLVCVGTGMKLGAHISPISRSYIENADVVFMGVSSGLVELWIQEMNGDVRSLQPYYQEGKSRLKTYKEMVKVMLDEVRKGKKVCGAFYGHPGVFAWAPHKAIEQAKAEGFKAHMEPGISAEDCLYADLGIDPGTYGCQHYEATQFLLYKKRIESTAYLILWQIGLTGDLDLTQNNAKKDYLEVLLDLLVKDYRPEHEVIIYSASLTALNNFSERKVPLMSLPNEKLSMNDTLVIPPAKKMLRNELFVTKLNEIV